MTPSPSPPENFDPVSIIAHINKGSRRKNPKKYFTAECDFARGLRIYSFDIQRAMFIDTPTKARPSWGHILQKNHINVFQAKLKILERQPM